MLFTRIRIRIRRVRCAPCLVPQRFTQRGQVAGAFVARLAFEVRVCYVCICLCLRFICICICLCLRIICICLCLCLRIICICLCLRIICICLCLCVRFASSSASRLRSTADGVRA